MCNSPLFFDALGIGLDPFRVVKARQDRLEQGGLIFLDGQQEIAVGLEDHSSQRPLAKQSIAGEEAEKRVVFDQLSEPPTESLGLGALAVGDRELSQAEADLVGGDVEHVDRVALGAVTLFAGLTVDGGGRGRGGLRSGEKPGGEGGAERLERELGQDAADRRGVRRPFVGETQRLLEASPVILGPPLETGHGDLAAKQAEKGQGEDR